MTDRRAYEREYWSRNHEKRLEIQRRYREKHKAKLAARLAAWRQANPEKYRAQHERVYESGKPAAWLAANKSRHNKWRRERHARLYAENPEYRLGHIVRGRLQSAFRSAKRSGSVHWLIGCSWSELTAHLESQFTNGMTWKNQGRWGWHIDHIIPLMAFDLSDPAQQQAACHYTNLRPLWAADNIKKGHRERRIYGV